MSRNVLETQDSRGDGRVLFLISPSKAPCGVEMFSRRLADACCNIGFREERLAIDGRAADVRTIWDALSRADTLVLNFPVVAWKKVILTPLLALVMARARGKQTVIVLHEWQDVDWRRRASLFVYSLFARHLAFSSPTVRGQFLLNPFSRARNLPSSILPVPANIELFPSSGGSARAALVRAARDQGKLAIGHFGSIYPKKQADFVLDVAAELKRLGRPVFVVFVGGFIRGRDNVERDFHEKVRSLGLADDVLVAGYIVEQQEISDLFGEADCFVYRFAEGLTSRRGSVLACIQTGKPVLVNAPAERDEFAHHRTYRAALESGALCLLDKNADATAYAESLFALPIGRYAHGADSFAQGWREAAYALADALPAPREQERSSTIPGALN